MSDPRAVGDPQSGLFKLRQAKGGMWLAAAVCVQCPWCQPEDGIDPSEWCRPLDRSRRMIGYIAGDVVDVFQVWLWGTPIDRAEFDFLERDLDWYQRRGWASARAPVDVRKLAPILPKGVGALALAIALSIGGAAMGQQPGQPLVISSGGPEPQAEMMPIFPTEEYARAWCDGLHFAMQMERRNRNHFRELAGQPEESVAETVARIYRIDQKNDKRGVVQTVVDSIDLYFTLPAFDLTVKTEDGKEVTCKLSDLK